MAPGPRIGHVAQAGCFRDESGTVIVTSLQEGLFLVKPRPRSLVF